MTRAIEGAVVKIPVVLFVIDLLVRLANALHEVIPRVHPPIHPAIGPFEAYALKRGNGDARCSAGPRV